MTDTNNSTPAGLDLPRLSALLDISADIVTVQIPELRQKHGYGAEVERNVANMLEASLCCLQRAIALAEVHPPTHAALSAMAVRVRAYLESTEAEAEAWAWVELDLLKEAATATKH